MCSLSLKISISIAVGKTLFDLKFYIILSHKLIFQSILDSLRLSHQGTYGWRSPNKINLSNNLKLSFREPPSREAIINATDPGINKIFCNVCLQLVKMSVDSSKKVSEKQFKASIGFFSKMCLKIGLPYSLLCSPIFGFLSGHMKSTVSKMSSNATTFCGEIGYCLYS